MKVLLVSDVIDLDSPSIYTLDVAEELVRLGHQVRLVCAGSRCDALLAGFRQEVKDAKGQDEDILVESPGLTTPVLSWVRKVELKRRLKGFGPEVVHACCESAADAGEALARAFGAPLLVTCHKYHDKPPFRLSPVLKTVITVSDALREHLVNEAGVPKELVAVLSNGINLRNYEVSFEEPEEDRTVVVGTFGKMLERKGQDYLLKAAARVLSEGRKAHFLFAGEGPQEGYLRSLAERLGVRENVTFSNYPFRAHSVIREMDIFVLPSVRESFGFSALEALAFGKPVVAFGVGGVYTFIKDGETGLIVPARDVEGLAAALLELIDDPAKRVRLGRQGRMLVEEKFAMEKLIPRLVGLYERAAGGGEAD